MNEAPSIGVIIPAHNGEETIHRSLSSIAAQEYDGSVRIAVVCNACRDETAAAARSGSQPSPTGDGCWRLSTAIQVVLPRSTRASLGWVIRSCCWSWIRMQN